MGNPSPIRVLHVVGGLNRGGAETWLMHILRHIDRETFRFDFLVHSSRPGAFDEEVRALGGRIHPCLSPHRPRQYARNFRAIMRRIGPVDIVHSHVHDFSGFALRLAHHARVPVRIVHSHCDTSPFDSKAGLVRRSYLRLMRGWISRHATSGIACSEKAAVCLFGSNWRSDPRWRLHYYGIDLTPFQAAVDRVALRAELGLPPGAFVVGHVGRFDPQKNHTFLLDIFPEVLRLVPNAVLLSLGVGPLRDSIEQKALRLGIRDRIFFLGSRPDVPLLMKGAMDVLLFPSHFEGLPLVLLEAQAAGLPCLISDAIADETTVVEPLIRRFPLSRPASDWASELSRFCQSGERTKASDAWTSVAQSQFNIDIGAASLAAYYRGQLRQAPDSRERRHARVEPSEVA